MTSASDRRYTRRDTVLIRSLSRPFAGRVSSRPTAWGYRHRRHASGRRSWRPWSGSRPGPRRVAPAGSASAAVTAERDSAAYLAQFLPSLRAENERLAPAAQAQPPAQHRLRAGRSAAPAAGHRWPHPAAERRAASGCRAVQPGGGTRGTDRDGAQRLPREQHGDVLGPSGVPGQRLYRERQRVRRGGARPIEGRNGEGALEFRGVPYRDSVPLGTLVLSSGLGGVFPKGIPVGTVIGTVREEAGWERVYRLRPAANPGSAAHVLVLVGPSRRSILRERLPQRLPGRGDAAGLDRADAPGRLGAAGAKAARAARRDSLVRRDLSHPGGHSHRAFPGTAPVSPIQGGRGISSTSPEDSAP